MPRIIEVAPVVEKQIVCEHCGRTIAYVPNDVKSHHGTDYGGGPSGSEWVDCPAADCGKDATVRRW